MLADLVTLQELGDERTEDRAARRRGYDILAALAALQRAILGAADDAASLLRLAELAADVPMGADPGLRAAVNALVLRARVEVVRRQG
jgi:hypothetical protein